MCPHTDIEGSKALVKRVTQVPSTNAMYVSSYCYISSDVCVLVHAAARRTYAGELRMLTYADV
jgi:hypothetical protein